jgi:hypothetical protein
MRHPAEGVLRRLVDEPAGVALADRRHVDGCARCADGLTVVRRDADTIGAALAVDDRPSPDTDDAWRRLSAATAGSPPRRATGWYAGRPRRSLGRPAAGALAVVVVLAGAGTAAAQNWVQVFGAREVAPLSIRPADLLTLPDLSAYGALSVPVPPDVHAVADAAAAARETGLDVPEVRDLPRGVAGAPSLQVGARTSATFTFSAERAARAATSAGEPAPAPPAGLDGTSVRLDAGPGVVQVWSSGSGVPALVVGRATAPTAFSTGLPFDQVRDYLLALPGVPDRLAEQLRAFAADGSTLPLPVPADQVRTRSAQVDGVDATVLTTRDGTLAAVVWVEDGTVTVVAGSIDDDEALDVARELR